MKSRKLIDALSCIDSSFIEDMENAGQKPRRTKSRHTALIILAACLAAALSVTAFAADGFRMKAKKPDGPVSYSWTEIDENGETIFEQQWNYPDAGMVFTFEGPEAIFNKPEFHLGWVPETFPQRYTKDDCWLKYISNPGSCMGRKIPFVINAYAIKPGVNTFVLNGKVKVLSEEYRDNWYIIKLSTDYSGTSIKLDNAGYILMFDEERGYLVNVGGTSDMEVLEKLAENLTVRESDTPQDENWSQLVGMLDAGRG